MWPKSHDDKKSLKEKGNIRDIPVVDTQGIEAAGLGILTRSQTSQMRIDELKTQYTDEKDWKN